MNVHYSLQMHAARPGWTDQLAYTGDLPTTMFAAMRGCIYPTD